MVHFQETEGIHVKMEVEVRGIRGKYLAFARRLERDIRAGRFRPGQPLPSVRALMASEKLSSATVTKGLNVLAERGMVDCFPQRGYFVSGSEPDETAIAPILYLTPALSGDVTPYIRGMQEAYPRNKYPVLSHSSYANLSRYEDMIREAVDLKPAGVILMAVPRSLFSADLSPLADSGIPTVVIGEPMSGLECDRVVQSGADSARKLLKHLLEKDCSNVSVLVSDDTDEGTRSFVNTLCQGFAEAGVDVPEDRVLRISTRRGWDSPADPYIDSELFLQHALEQGLKLGTLICRSDYYAVGAIRAIQAVGLRVPQDVRVASSVQCAIEGVMRTRLTTVDTRREEHGRVAMELLMRRISGYDGPPEVHHVSGDLIVGETT